MSNKHDALKFLAANATKTPTVVDIFNALKNCETASAVVVMMSTLKAEGLVEVAGKVGKQNQWRISAAGRQALDELEASGGGRPFPAKKPWRGPENHLAR